MFSISKEKNCNHCVYQNSNTMYFKNISLFQICIGNHDPEDKEILLIYIVPFTLNHIFTLLVDIMTYVKKELNSKTPLTIEYCLSNGTKDCNITETSREVNDFCI